MARVSGRTTDVCDECDVYRWTMGTAWRNCILLSGGTKRTIFCRAVFNYTVFSRSSSNFRTFTADLGNEIAPIVRKGSRVVRLTSAGPGGQLVKSRSQWKRVMRGQGPG